MPWRVEWGQTGQPPLRAIDNGGKLSYLFSVGRTERKDMKRQKILYIPIEESARDLETRLLLAHVAIADGWQVVLSSPLRRRRPLWPSG
jgi:hypothetical protein